MDRRGDSHHAGNPASFSTISTKENSPSDESDFSATVLSYIDQMLMEEDMDKSCMFHDSLALQAAEKSFYDVIGEKYPSSSSSSSSSIQHHLPNYPNMESPEDSLSGNFSDYSISISSSYGTTSTSNSAESQWSSIDPTNYNSSIMPNTFPLPPNFVFQSNSTSSTQSSTNYNSDFTTTNTSGFLGTSMSGFFDSTLLSKSEYLLQFNRGIEQGTKFLPRHSPFNIDTENTTFSPSFRKAPQVVIKIESDEGEHFPIESKGRKNPEREDDEAEVHEGRSNKQSAVYMDGSECWEN